MLINYLSLFIHPLHLKGTLECIRVDNAATLVCFTLNTSVNKLDVTCKMNYAVNRMTPRATCHITTFAMSQEALRARLPLHLRET